MERIINKNILAILPVYKEGQGDSTRLVLDAGRTLVYNMSINSFITGLFKAYCLDYKSSKAYYSRLLKCRNLFPLVLGPSLVLIPFKSRLPRQKNDRAFGYVNLDAIDYLDDRGDFVLIRLKDGRALKSLLRLQSSKNHLLNGHIVKREALSLEAERNKSCRDLIPASKRDVDLLIREIEKLKYFIK